MIDIAAVVLNNRRCEIIKKKLEVDDLSSGIYYVEVVGVYANKPKLVINNMSSI